VLVLFWPIVGKRTARQEEQETGILPSTLAGSHQ
jgi:hypothetical protein